MHFPASEVKILVGTKVFVSHARVHVVFDLDSMEQSPPEVITNACVIPFEESMMTEEAAASKSNAILRCMKSQIGGRQQTKDVSDKRK